MAVAFGSIASATNGAAGSITITKPASLNVGDLMVASISHVSAFNFYTASGWTAVNTADGSNDTVSILLRIADLGDTAASDFTFTQGGGGTSASIGYIIRLTGSFLGSTPAAHFEWSGVDRRTEQNITFLGGVTQPRGTNSLLILSVSTRHTDVVTASGYAVTNNNPSWTERVDTGNSTTDYYMHAATATYASDSDTGDFLVNLSVDPSDVTSGVLMSIQETTNVTVTPAVVTMAASVQAPSVVGHANVSPAVVTITASVQSPTVTNPDPDWSNLDKSSAPSWTNLDKS